MKSRIKALQDRKATLVRDANAILDKVQAESRDAMTDEETAALNQVKAKISSTEELLKIEAELQEQERSLAGTGVGAIAGGQAGGHIGNARPAFVEDPKKGFKTHREFLLGVMAATQRGGTNDERLLFLGGNRNNFGVTAGSDEQGGYSEPYGGFLVPAGFSPQFFSLEAETQMEGMATTLVPMSAPSVKFNARVDKDHRTSVSGGLTVKRRIETQSQAASRMAFEQVELRADSLYGLAYATNELLQDSPISFIAMLDQGFRAQFNWHLLGEKLEGTGVGEYTGIRNSPAKIAVTKEAGQDAKSIVWENIVNMEARCWNYGRAVWHYNHDCLPQLKSLVMPIGTAGIAMWQTSGVTGTPALLNGRPAYPSEHCETVGAEGDLILTVWSEFLEGIYQPIQSAESIHVRFEANETAFRFTMRCGGSPWWRSALTPKKSASTLSPIVTLAVRS